MLEAYDGSSDLTEHVAAFYTQMTLYGTSDAIICQAFPMTLQGIARGYTRPKPTTASLLGMRQKEEEHLGQYLAHFTDEPREPSLRPKGPVERHIDVIVGGLATVGVSSSTRKAYARAEVQKRPRPRGDPGFTFEFGSEYPDHDNGLVVTARIANAYVRHIMIDTGSSADILYLDAFHKLGMTNRDLAPMTSTLTGFIGDAITPVSIATLPVTFGDEPITKTLMVHLMVVDFP
ncbi:hypothetical protein GW17_00061337 [Ensete ventricosum]|nr:hypothetical protein GW17_00061337 [Ensete ventricosum]